VISGKAIHIVTRSVAFSRQKERRVLNSSSQIRPDFYPGNQRNGHCEAQVCVNEEISTERDMIVFFTISDLNILSVVRSDDTYFGSSSTSHVRFPFIHIFCGLNSILDHDVCGRQS
jgi:hypothetical protein